MPVFPLLNREKNTEMLPGELQANRLIPDIGVDLNRIGAWEELMPDRGGLIHGFVMCGL